MNEHLKKRNSNVTLVSDTFILKTKEKGKNVGHLKKRNEYSCFTFLGENKRA
jgi:hypothetical protein